MKRTYDANIGGTVFHIEEDAYARLAAYLESVQAHFRSDPDSVDIAADIESRIAEQWTQRNAFSRVVTHVDVEAIIGVMGSVDQFDNTVAPAGEPGNEEATPAAGPSGRRRLFRDPADRVVAGVAAGVARSCGLAPRWIRLAFLLPVPLTLFLGATELLRLRGEDVMTVAMFTVLPYLLLWLFLPRKQTSAETAGDASPAGRRRLFRDPDTMLIAGVAAGVARYCGIAPGAIRLALLLPVPFMIFLGITRLVHFRDEDLTKFGTFEVIAYLLLWLLIPLAKTSIDKLRMRGHAVTLASVAQRVRDEGAVPTSRSGATALAVAIGSIFRTLVLGMAWLTGVLLAGWTIVTIIGLTVLLTVVMTNPAIIPVIRKLALPTAMGVKFYSFAVCSYLLAVIPLVLIGTIVVTELQQRRGVRWNRPAPSVYIAAMAVWMVALIAWAWFWASSINPDRPFWGAG